MNNNKKERKQQEQQRHSNSEITRGKKLGDRKKTKHWRQQNFIFSKEDSTAEVKVSVVGRKKEALWFFFFHPSDYQQSQSNTPIKHTRRPPFHNK